MVVNIARLDQGMGFRTVMRLVHEPEQDLTLCGVLSRQLTPQTCELLIRWTTLSNDCSVPASIVMDIDKTVTACS